MLHDLGATKHKTEHGEGTPSKLLQMARGNGWDKKFGEGEDSRRRKWVVGRPDVSLADVERWSSTKRTFFSVRLHTLTPSSRVYLTCIIDPGFICSC